MKENGYADDYGKDDKNVEVKEKDYVKNNAEENENKSFTDSLILDDDFDEEEDYHSYEEGSASAYMERLRLQEEELSVRSFLEEQEDM